MDDPQDAWDAIATTIRSRMADLGLSQKDVADRSGLSRETIRPVLTGVPGNYRDSTLSRISIALDWTGGSLAAMVAGGQPTVSDRTPVGTWPTDYNSRIARMPPEVEAEINRIIDEEERKRGLR